MTIDLASYGSDYYKSFGASDVLEAVPEFRQLHLAYYWNRTYRHLTLDDWFMSCYGFARCGAFPYNIVNNSVGVFSHTNDLVILVYANDNARARFAVGFGYYFDQQWVHVVCDDTGDCQSRWEDYAKEVYEQLWSARKEHAGNMPEVSKRFWSTPKREPKYYIKHAHLPRSIWAAKVVWDGCTVGNTTLTVDVDQCTGCCYGPLEWKNTANDRHYLPMPGLMKVYTCDYEHRLSLGGVNVGFLECGTKQIKLGDYGDWNHQSKSFEPCGNISDNLGAYSMDSANSQMVSATNKDDDHLDTVITSVVEGCPLLLFKPTSLSIPGSREFVSLLKRLSMSLTEKYLVTAVVSCSAHRKLSHRSALGQIKEFEMEVRTRENGRAEMCQSHDQQSFKSGLLYSIAQPQVWRRDSLDKQKRKQLKEIREQFYVLVKLRSPIMIINGGRLAAREQDSNATKDAARFFSNLFGVEYLERYIGDITFFKRLASFPKSKRGVGPPSAAASGSDNSRGCQDLFPDQPFTEPNCLPDAWKERRTAQDPRIFLAVVENLLKIIQKCGRWELKSSDAREIESEVKSISETFGLEVLEILRAFYIDALNRRILLCALSFQSLNHFRLCGIIF